MKFFKKHKKGLIIFGVIAVLLIAGFFWLRSIGNKAMEQLAAMTSETAVAEKRDVANVVSTTGKVVSVESKDLSSIVTGVKVSEVYVQVGDEVKAGDLLVKLDSENLEEDLANAQTTLSNTQKANNLSVGSAQRVYNEAVTNQAISAERIVKDIEDAQKKLDEAKNVKGWYDDMYEDAKKKLETAENNYNAAVNALGALSSVSGNEVDQAKKNVATLNAAVEVERANVSKWLSNYESEKANITSLEKTLETLKQNQVDTQRSTDSNIQASRESLSNAQIQASGSTKSVERQISTFEDQIDSCSIVAPFDGVVTDVAVEKGAIYTGTPAVRVEDINAYEISTEIDEFDIGKIKVGQKVVIKTNGTGDEELEGVVKSIAPRATPMKVSTDGTSAVTYTTKISILTKNDMLKLDMTAKLSIILDESNGSLTVPYDAVMTDEETGDKYVEIIDAKDEKTGMVTATHKEIVTTGLESEYYVVITGGNLKEGDEVKITRDIADVFDFSVYMNEGATSGM
ncbi:MAG: efflux RND transporter periplasmic adaptor subunit [Lachnospiraceae bacterium]|nr:efflux RND transporter periplasmic adaptor subunit [Lachnospiraceae bacterium]